MTPTEIRIEFIKRREHTSMAKLARKLGVSHQAVQRIIDGESVSERIMIAVAEAIDIPPEKVFPDKQFKKQPTSI